MGEDNVRRFAVEGRSTDTFGRVMLSTRGQHFVADGPIHNGCPGEALTPAELFLAGVAACGVELVEVIAREEGVDVGGVRASIAGEIDPDNPVRDDVTVMTRVRLRFEIDGTNAEQAEMLVDRFKRRCPLYGSVAVATPDLEVEVAVKA